MGGAQIAISGQLVHQVLALISTKIMSDGASNMGK